MYISNHRQHIFVLFSMLASKVMLNVVFNYPYYICHWAQIHKHHFNFNWGPANNTWLRLHTSLCCVRFTIPSSSWYLNPIVTEFHLYTFKKFSRHSGIPMHIFTLSSFDQEEDIYWKLLRLTTDLGLWESCGYSEQEIWERSNDTMCGYRSQRIFYRYVFGAEMDTHMSMGSESI